MYELEQGMERELFIRHDRGYELTTDGNALLEGLTEIEGQIQRHTNTPARRAHPLVKISSGTWTTFALINSIDQLLGSPQDTLLRLVSAEKVLDISHREVVIGIRNQRPKEESLVCRKLARVEFALYATQSAPDAYINLVADTPSSQWLNSNIKSNIICEVNNPRNCLDLAIKGKGITLLPTFVGDTEPQLHRIGNIIDELSHDQWLVTHHEDRYLPEVRRLIQRLCLVLDQTKS
jgi:DNA-binding transcriptional LysR family regulator